MQFSTQDDVDGFEVELVPVQTPLHATASRPSSSSSHVRSIAVVRERNAPFVTGLSAPSSTIGSAAGGAQPALDCEGGSPVLLQSSLRGENRMADVILAHEQQPPSEQQDEQPPAGWFKTLVHDVATNVVLSFHYTRTDIMRRPRNCCMGFTAVFLVVFFTMIVIAAISKTSYLLLRFAELSVGEMDAVVYTTDGVPVVNYSSVAHRFEANASATVSGSSPRWIARGVLRSWEKLLDVRDGQVSYDSIPSLTVNILVVDAAHEPKVGIGRAWPYRQVGYGEAQVTDTALEYLGIQSNIGDRSNLLIELAKLLDGQGLVLPPNITLPSTSFNVTTNAQQVIDALIALGINLTVVNVSSTTVNATTRGDTTQITINGLSVNTSTLLAPLLDFNIADGIEESYGKYPASLGNVMLIDYHRLLRLVSDQSCVGGSAVFTADGGASTFPPSAAQLPGLQSALNDFDLSDYALIVVAMFHDRFSTYYKENVALGKDMIRNSNEMVLALDYRYKGDIVYPVAMVMEGFQAFNSIITSVFGATVIVVLVLSAILVYSLLGMNGEERQFELAMIRSQGMTRTQLVYIMMGEVVAFVIPGVGCGVCLAIAANAVIERVLSDFVHTPYEPLRLPVWGVIFSIVAGFAMPVVSNWTPVMESMRASLRDALDVNRQKWSETQVSMLKLEELGLQPWQSFLGLFLVVAGFMVYYLLPMSFIYNNLLMFFMIMNIILLIMLFGLCLIVVALQGRVSQIWLWLIMWGREKRLHTLVDKSMESHAARNKRAFIMFVLTISSVIFGGIAFQSLADGLVQVLELASGADMLIVSSSFDVPLNTSVLDAYLTSQHGISVASWAYVTFRLAEYPQVIASTALRNVLGRSQPMMVVGVTENYLGTVFPEYVEYGGLAAGHAYPTSSTGVVDVVRNLYTDPLADSEGRAEILYTGYPENISRPDALEKVKNVIPVLVASGVRDAMGLDVNGIAAVDFSYRLENGIAQSTAFLVQPRALMNRLSGFAGMSPRRFGLAAGATIMTTDNFHRLVMANETDFFGVTATSSTNLADDYVSDVRFEKLMVRMMPGLSERRRTFFLNSLQSYLDPYHSTSTDLQAVVKTVRQISNLLFVFFYFSAAICVLLASFMTWLVFVSNVTQNAWSFGVLRSLGFTKGQVLRSVVYEAVVLVLSSFTLGLPIGTFVGFTLRLQLSTFLNLPFDFKVPYIMLLILLGISILATTLGSAIPMRKLNKMQIAQVIKKYN